MFLDICFLASFPYFSPSLSFWIIDSYLATLVILVKSLQFDLLCPSQPPFCHLLFLQFCVTTLNCFLLCCQGFSGKKLGGRQGLKWVVRLKDERNTWDLESKKTKCEHFSGKKNQKSWHSVMTGILAEPTMWLGKRQDGVSVAAFGAHNCRDRMCVNDCRSPRKRGVTLRNTKQLTTIIHSDAV